MSHVHTFADQRVTRYSDPAALAELDGILREHRALDIETLDSRDPISMAHLLRERVGSAGHVPTRELIRWNA